MPLLVCLAAAAALSVGAILPSASAAPAASPGSLEPAAQFLMDKYHLTAAEAIGRATLQDHASALQDDLDSALGERYGGLWIDQPGGGIVVVGVRPGQEPAVRELATRHQVTRLRVVTVERTIAQLRAIQSQLRNAVAADVAATGLQVGGLYLPTNQVNLRVDPTVHPKSRGADLASRLERAHPGRVRFVPVEGVAKTTRCVVNGASNVWCDPPLRGGVGITASGGQCSAGFNVRSVSDGKRYLLTAGHCDVGGIWRTRFANNEIHDIGPRHNSVFNANGDAMIIRVNNPAGWNPKPWVFVTGDGSTTRDETYSIGRAGTTSIGMSVCMTGRRDGTECGEVIDNDTPGAGGVRHVAEVRGGCIRTGDSGGAVYRNHTAFGIVHGGRFPGGDGDRCSTTWFYQGIRGAMSQLNVRLVTTANP
jgi:hypothetical protein